MFFFCLVTKATGQNTYWQQQVHYIIDVTLDDASNTLDGFIKIQYTNNSPDTLRYIWFHLWPNAFKSDKTAFSEQLLENRKTQFYFSSEEKKGYINRLDFRIDDIRVDVEDHPGYLDVVRLMLPVALMPGKTVLITTPFHVKIPYNFSGNGYKGQAYQLAEWFPKPAVYDRLGWHPMPYLGEASYNEVADFDVRITLPDNYAVAASGDLQNEEEKEWLKKRASFTWREIKQRKKIKGGSYKTIRQLFPPSSKLTKTLRYTQHNGNEFSWIADKRFAFVTDTCLLSSGRMVEVNCFFIGKADPVHSIEAAKKAVRYCSSLIEYPCNTINIVTQAVNSRFYRIVDNAADQYWLNGSIGTNNFDHPWMNKGVKEFYDQRHLPDQHNINKGVIPFAEKNMLYRFYKLAFETLASAKKDQAIDLPFTDFTAYNYPLSTRYKTTEWLKLLEKDLGKTTFDSCMQNYSRQWHFKHPYPQDFKNVFVSAGGKNTDSVFQLLTAKGSLIPSAKRRIEFVLLGKPDPERKHNYIGVAPALGFNYYDKLMLGAIIHNYSLPFNRFQFIAVPLYATGSKQLNGIGRAGYTWYPGSFFYKSEIGVSAEKFSANTYTNDDGVSARLGFTKVSPYLRLTFNNKDPHSHLTSFIQLKSYFMREDGLHFSYDSVLMKNVYTVSGSSRTIGQLRFVTDNSRVLYPYHSELQFELSKDFGRLAWTGDYFFNYANSGGLKVRGFAGKFFYIGRKETLNTDPFKLNMTAPKGDEDYTYSNYFIGRNEYSGILSQQVMMRDGGFKVRTDFLSNKTGKTDGWLAALNFVSSFHAAVPAKLFVDIGTYSDAWDKDADVPRLLFDAGIQLSLLKDVLNVYVPVAYSKVYRNYFRSTPGNNFWQRISFSIDIQKINFKKISPLIPL